MISADPGILLPLKLNGLSIKISAYEGLKYIY